MEASGGSDDHGARGWPRGKPWCCYKRPSTAGSGAGSAAAVAVGPVLVSDDGADEWGSIDAGYGGAWGINV
ncbi:hypothetical protein L1987_29991 [Smallanthus sonchifolius]|uniref:Uncharacterized protein n=1 Tax=Smallanthus sonchifolius TaxID=185202 RepID=A0ACB9I1L6_9ASTR|nr:hypothetical protein L1987_29991 [Smallanthus sonchifolius]